ncbi:MAG: short-chain type dehydrogenase/reductase [Subtercola sp.]|nr:short-chain type dehydrogenase/reductase [Subtercola sp.]
MQLTDSVAFVTGGSSGLGLATTKALLAGGASVVIADLASSQGAQLAEELGDRVLFAPTDVTSESDVAAALDLAATLGRLNIVVNCAGISIASRVVGRKGPFALDAFSKVVQVNLIGTFNVIRLASEWMIDTPNADETVEERGVIINTASVAAFDGQIGQAAYSASKGGVVGMTLPIARDLAEHKIRVMTIAPGIFHTPMFDALPPESIVSLGAQTPHPARLGAPDEYASLALHIIDNPMLNGETIRLDGAIRLAPR